MMHETIWFDRLKFEAAEAHFQTIKAGPTTKVKTQVKDTKPEASQALSEISKARENIQQSLKGAKPSSTGNAELHKQIASLEKENKELQSVVNLLKNNLEKLEQRVVKLEISGDAAPKQAQQSPAPKPAPAPPAKDDSDSDSDVDLFGSSDEEEKEERERKRQENLQAYRDKKAKKPAVIPKSNIIFDIKPWDDETDLGELEKAVRAISCDGLRWTASKLIPMCYGIKKLQIACNVEDDKCGTDFLEESITAFEDMVQSVDVVAFNKL